MDMKICVVTVTYGNRFNLLHQVIDALLTEQSVERVIIVDNNTETYSKERLRMLEERIGWRLQVIYLTENTGSANGYKIGLEEAEKCEDCEYIWLLDDDNVPEQNALIELRKKYQELYRTIPADRLALLALRAQREDYMRVANGVPPRKVFSRKSSFRGLHILDIPSRIANGLIRIHFKQKPTMTTAIEIPYAPYGGLFFHKSILSTIGFPDERFWLYSDDHEYSYRLTCRNGKIFLIPSSVVHDIDVSWTMKKKSRNILPQVLRGKSDQRVYYSVRNRAYLDRHVWAANHLIYFLNKYLYLLFVGMVSLSSLKLQRYLLIIRAVRDGESKRFNADQEKLHHEA